MTTEPQILSFAKSPPTRGPRKSTIRGKPLDQNKLFMQNKPNLLNAQINVSPVLIKNYEDNRTCSPRKSKPNKANMNVTKALTTNYENKRPPTPAKTNPIQTQLVAASCRVVALAKTEGPCLAIASCDGGWRSRIKPNFINHAQVPNQSPS